MVVIVLVVVFCLLVLIELVVSVWKLGNMKFMLNVVIVQVSSSCYDVVIVVIDVKLIVVINVFIVIQCCGGICDSFIISICVRIRFMFMVVSVNFVIWVLLVGDSCSWLIVKKFIVICVMVIEIIVVKIVSMGSCRCVLFQVRCGCGLFWWGVVGLWVGNCYVIIVNVSIGSSVVMYSVSDRCWNVI